MMLPRLSQGSAEMEKLDQLVWAGGFSFRAYGLRIGIRTNSADVLALVKRRLPITWKPSRSPVVDNLYSVVKPRAKGKRTGPQFNILYKGSEMFARSTDLIEVLSELEIDLHSYIATATLQRMFLHAGVVGWNGKAIVIPGKNFSGKTSLVTAFLRAGATYYSDEFAVLDSRGRVHPYPWALHIREGLAQPKAFPVEMLGARAGTKPLPVGVVILSEYRRGAKWRPRRVTRGQAALAMLDRVMSKRHQPGAMLPALGQMVSGATVLKGTRGEAKEVVESVLQKFVDSVKID